MCGMLSVLCVRNEIFVVLMLIIVLCVIVYIITMVPFTIYIFLINLFLLIQAQFNCLGY